MTSILTPSEVVASNVRAGMARRRITQAVLASALGMTQQAFSRRLNGEVPFTVDQVYAIADQLQVEPTSLLAPEPATAVGT